MVYSDFIEGLPQIQAGIYTYMDQLILKHEGTSRKIRYRIPFYDYNSWFCYINPVKVHQAELCFLRGVEMKASFPILNQKKRKMVTGLLLDGNEDFPHELIVDLINHAISLNK